MRLLILTTAREPFHKYYANRLHNEFPGWAFKVIAEEPVDCSALRAGKEKLKTLVETRDWKGLARYFPYVKTDVFRRRRAEFEKGVLKDVDTFRPETAFVENNNDAFPLIAGFDPDLIIVFGSRPLRRELLEKVTCPIVNHHGAILPFFRGLDAEYWLACYREFEYIGCSIHYVTEGLDEGAILLTRRLEITPGMKIDQIRGARARLHAEMMIDLLRDWENARNSYRANETEKGIYRSFSPFWVQLIAAYNLWKVKVERLRAL